MRKVAFINIVNIVVDRHSISPQSFDLAKKLEKGTITLEDLPTIKVVEKGGTFILKDGRHRITAVKLIGETRIKARYYKKN